MPYDFGHPVIICNVDYFRELEVVIRYFKHFENVSSTDALEALVRLLRGSPKKALVETRANTEMRKLEGEEDQHIADHMSMVLLFLLTHEYGHLLS